MKSIKLVVSVILIICAQGAYMQASAQATELAQLALNIEKLAQFKSILSDLKKGYEIVFKGYSTVKDIAEGNFSIHKTFLDGLMAVSPTVRQYKKIPMIIDYQIQLVKEYKSAFQRFKRQGMFNENEINYLGAVYSNLVDQSLQNLDELITITTAGKLRMGDDERLVAIDRICADMEDKLNFLRDFNHDTGLLSLSRAKEKAELETLERFQGMKENN